VAIYNAYPGFSLLLQQAKADALGDLTWPSITKVAATVIGGIPA
jgi:hypothetical protein